MKPIILSIAGVLGSTCAVSAGNLSPAVVEPEPAPVVEQSPPPQGSVPSWVVPLVFFSVGALATTLSDDSD